MGKLTRDSIVSQGMLLAGRDGIATRMNEYLENWSQSTYAGHIWPFLTRRVSGVALAAGTQSFSLGGGANGVAAAIERIFDPAYVYTGDYKQRSQMRVRQLVGGPLDIDETVIDPTTNIGIPRLMKVRANATTWGTWTVIPYPFPKQDYLVAIDYQVQPAAIAQGTEIPIYPNDRTLVQAVKTGALEYANRERWAENLEILAAMVIDDREKYGQVPGNGDLSPLDGGTFLEGQPMNDPYGWGY